VFVANPNKPQAIVDILTNNREKLLKYLEDFHTDRGEVHASTRLTEIKVSGSQPALGTRALL
jgi:hypothetical protein